MAPCLWSESAQQRVRVRVVCLHALAWMDGSIDRLID